MSFGSWRLRLSLAWPPPLAPLAASLPSASDAAFSRASIPAAPSHPARCARQDGHPSSAENNQRLMQTASGKPDGSRQTPEKARENVASPGRSKNFHRPDPGGGMAGVACCRAGRSASIAIVSCLPAGSSPSHPARCARQDGVRAISVSCRRSPDGSRQTRKRPAKTSPRSEAGRHRSSRTAAIACRQPQDARSGRASSECRTPPWL